MSARVVALAIACATAVAGACTDPGCIRNSECPIEFRCIDAVCLRSSADAGATAGSSAPAIDAATETDTDASISPPRDAAPPRDSAPPRDTSNPTGEDAGR